jgi:hypothetical protein
MKRAVSLLIVLFALQGHNMAQQKAKSPYLFNQLPGLIDCTEAQLAQLFSASKGQVAAFEVPGAIRLQGTVVNKYSKYQQLETIVLQLPAYDNILFAISRRNDVAKGMVYIGHLYSSKHADGYSIRAGNNGYQMKKITTASVLQPCDQ